MRWTLRSAVVVPAIIGLIGLAVGVAGAHAERDANFPPGTGSVPEYRPMVADPRLVVCADESADGIAAIDDAALRAINEALLAECGFTSIQDAVYGVTQRGTTIYVLPGLYREGAYRELPACGEGYNGGILEYQAHWDCPSLVNLITILGDDPAAADIVCDQPVCDLQIEGTGDDPGDVTIEGGYDDAGEYVKHNGIRADRADGIYLRNFTIQSFRENAVYILETDGFVIDRVVARWNDRYGFLTFADDHGLYTDCEAYGNGDSGVYPGSASDLNSDSTEAGITRWAIEVTRCSSHHNALGYSGTAGNSVYVTTTTSG